MRVGVLSDLHLEDNGWSPLPPGREVDVVVLAGDIARGLDGVEWAERAFSSPVLYVPGNHEYYDHDARDLCVRLARVRSGVVTVLDRTRVDLGEGRDAVRFLGCTLWTDFRAGEARGVPAAAAMDDIARRMRDVDRITVGRRHLTCEDVAAWHARDLAWLDRSLGEPFEGATVVVTHHAPSTASRHPAYPPDSIMPYFVSDLEDVIRRHKPAVWAHGHTHHCVDYAIGPTRVVSNQLGQPGRTSARKAAYLAGARPFDPTLVLDVP